MNGGTAMIDDVERGIDSIVKLAEKWNESKERLAASELQMKLSVLKLLIGIEKFDELPYFSRLLRDVTKYLDDEYAKEQKEARG